MPSFAIAAPVDTQQQIITIYEKIYLENKIIIILTILLKLLA